jgi:hypothetical protein
MSRAGKSLLGAAVLLLLLAAGTAWWFFTNLDGIAQRAIAHYGSEMSGCKVSVDGVKIRTTDGSGAVHGLVVGNPAGFKSAHAIKVGVIEVAVDIHTVADPVVVIRRIVIDSPDVNYEKGADGTNFDAIQRNIARALAAGADGAAQTSASGKPAKKIIVDEFVIRNAHAHASSPALLGQSVSATLPDVVLRHLGRAEGGLTPAQLGDRVAKAISQRLVVSLGFERALKSLGDKVKGIFGR